MGTVLDYLKEYGDLSFREKPMTEVDSLALCQLSYLKFDGLVPGMEEEGETVALKSLAERPDYDKLFGDTRYEKANRALMQGMLSGKRFGDLKLGNYVNQVEKQCEMQFSAVTCLLDDGTAYVAYRGTDESIVGWKEDFNMAFLTPVPGQEHSVAYLNRVAGSLDCPLYVGGHSKGGNLAVYSAMKCSPQVQERIRKVYSLDGPGFRPEVLRAGEYERIAGRVVKILPHSSLVGMLFEQDMRFEVVESKTFGLAQHDLYTWRVKEDHLVRADDIYQRRKQMDHALNQWILSLDEEQLHTFVDTLYQVVSASQAEDLIEFRADWKKSMDGMLAAIRKVDPKTRQVLKEIIAALFEIAGAQMRPEFNRDQHRDRPETGR